MYSILPVRKFIWTYFEKLIIQKHFFSKYIIFSTYAYYAERLFAYFSACFHGMGLLISLCRLDKYFYILIIYCNILSKFSINLTKRNVCLHVYPLTTGNIPVFGWRYKRLTWWKHHCPYSIEEIIIQFFF